MSTQLLFRDTMVEDPTAALLGHTPTPFGGPPWEYNATPGAYLCHPTGFLDGPSGSPDPARNQFSLPLSVTLWRMVIDIKRGGTDFVGGGFAAFAYCSDVAIASFDTPNSIAFGVARRSISSVQFSVQYNLPGGGITALLSADIEHQPNTWQRYIVECDELAGRFALYVADAFTGWNERSLAQAAVGGSISGTGVFPVDLATHIATDTTHRLIAVQGGWAGSGLVYFAARDVQVWELEPQVEPADQAIIPFPFRFQWPIVETFSFATSVLEAEDQNEQRIALRDPDVPRREFRARVVAHTPGESDHLQAVLFGRNLNPYYVPQWQHAMHLTAAAVATDTTLQLSDTTLRELLTGRPLMLYRSWNQYEVVVIDTVDSPTQVTLVDTLVGDWTQHATEVIPLRAGRLAAVVPVTRPTAGLAELDMDWLLEAVP